MTKVEIKKDCLFYKKDNCIALKALYCRNENCKFYKKKRLIKNDKTE